MMLISEGRTRSRCFSRARRPSREDWRPLPDVRQAGRLAALRERLRLLLAIKAKWCNRGQFNMAQPRERSTTTTPRDDDEGPTVEELIHLVSDSEYRQLMVMAEQVHGNQHPNEARLLRNAVQCGARTTAMAAVAAAAGFEERRHGSAEDEGVQPGRQRQQPQSISSSASVRNERPDGLPEIYLLDDRQCIQVAEWPSRLLMVPVANVSQHLFDVYPPRQRSKWGRIVSAFREFAKVVEQQCEGKRVVFDVALTLESTKPSRSKIIKVSPSTNPSAKRPQQ